jgi:preprotein translocase subunit Sec61beta
MIPTELFKGMCIALAAVVIVAVLLWSKEDE